MAMKITDDIIKDIFLNSNPEKELSRPQFHKLLKEKTGSRQSLQTIINRLDFAVDGQGLLKRTHHPHDKKTWIYTLREDPELHQENGDLTEIGFSLFGKPIVSIFIKKGKK